MLESVVSQSVSQSGGATSPVLVGALLADLRAAAKDDFEVHGLLDAPRSGVLEFLARDTSADRLVGLRMTSHGNTTVGSQEEYRVRSFDLASRFRSAPDAECDDCGSPVSSSDESCGSCGLHLADTEAGLATVSLSAKDEIAGAQRAVGASHRVLGRLSSLWPQWFLTVRNDSGAITAVRVRRVPTKSGAPPFAYSHIATHVFARGSVRSVDAPGAAASGGAARGGDPVDDRSQGQGPGGASDVGRAPAPSVISVKTCPTCQREFEPDSKFCQHCGTQLVLQGQTEPFVGTTIAGKYDVKKRLGKGGFGQVFLVHHAAMDRMEALKVMRPDLETDPDMVKRFEREAKNAARVRGEHVAVVYDRGRDSSGMFYLSMEYIEGGTLGERLQGGALPIAEAAAIGIHICRALAAAHSLQPSVVHRDLKPANVMLAKASDGRALAKVVDFGISKAMGDPSQSVSGTGTEIGTWPYMSPEQFGAAAIDTRTDLYAFGCVLYEMLTGVRAYPQKNKEGILHAKLMEGPPSARALRPEVSQALDGIVQRCLARLEARYTSADEVRADLESVLRGVQPAPRPKAEKPKPPPPPAPEERKVAGPVATAGGARGGSRKEGDRKPWAPTWVYVLAGVGVTLLAILVEYALLVAPKVEDTGERARLAAVRSDLRNLVTAQEVFFADSLKYAARASSLDLRPTSGASVRVASHGYKGYTAVADLEGVPQCFVRVGDGGDRLGDEPRDLALASAVIEDLWRRARDSLRDRRSMAAANAFADSAFAANEASPLCASRRLDAQGERPWPAALLSSPECEYGPREGWILDYLAEVPQGSRQWAAGGPANREEGAGMGKYALYFREPRAACWVYAGPLVGRGGRVSSIVVDPSDRNTVFVGTIGERRSGVYRTRDGAGTWHNVLYVNDFTGATDLRLQADVSGLPQLMATMMDETTFAASRFRSRDGGETWSREQ